MHPISGQFFRPLGWAVAWVASATTTLHAQPVSKPVTPTTAPLRQVTQATAQVSNPSIPVPAVAYRSAFATFPRGVESGQVDWKATNQAVGQFKRGHMDLLQWEQGRATVPPEGAKP